MTVFVIEGWIELAAAVLLALVKLFAVIDAVFRPARGYLDAGKLTKPGWIAILAFSLVVQALFLSPLQLLNLVGTVASFVYLLDVRPTLARYRSR